MSWSYHRTYRGPLQAVVFDWAGTTVDFGCFAPTAVFRHLFASRGVPIDVAEARAPMGLPKRDHLRAVLATTAVAQRWEATHGRPWSEHDVDELFAEFVPAQLAVIPDHSEPVPGARELMDRLRQRGLAIGSTTGYTRPMMEVLVPEARARGYEPDTWVCPDDVPQGRPLPWMLYVNAMRLGTVPMAAMVKVGDTVPDLEEGLNAGTWTVGVALSGNELGLTDVEVDDLDPATRAGYLEAIGARLSAVGAHYVIEGVWALDAVLDEIEQRLRRGERP